MNAPLRTFKGIDLNISQDAPISSRKNLDRLTCHSCPQSVNGEASFSILTFEYFGKQLQAAHISQPAQVLQQKSPFVFYTEIHICRPNAILKAQPTSIKKRQKELELIYGHLSPRQLHFERALTGLHNRPDTLPDRY